MFFLSSAASSCIRVRMYAWDGMGKNMWALSTNFTSLCVCTLISGTILFYYRTYMPKNSVACLVHATAYWQYQLFVGSLQLIRSAFPFDTVWNVLGGLLFVDICPHNVSGLPVLRAIPTYNSIKYIIMSTHTCVYVRHRCMTFIRCIVPCLLIVGYYAVYLWSVDIGQNFEFRVVHCTRYTWLETIECR